MLDFVNEDTRRMQSRLDPRDREKLDQYLTGIREVEIRIQKAERFGANVDPDLATPAGIPRSHLPLLHDVQASALHLRAVVELSEDEDGSLSLSMQVLLHPPVSCSRELQCCPAPPIGWYLLCRATSCQPASSFDYPREFVTQH